MNVNNVILQDMYVDGSLMNIDDEGWKPASGTAWAEMLHHQQRPYVKLRKLFVPQLIGRDTRPKGVRMDCNGCTSFRCSPTVCPNTRDSH